MKVLLTADLHLYSQPSMDGGHESGIPSRLIDRWNCWHWVCDVAAKHGCEGIFVLGDIFHDREHVDLPSLYVAGQCFASAAERFEWVAALVGNHDSYLRIPTVQSAAALSGHVQVVDAPVVEQWASHTVGMVPWMDDEDALALAIDAVVEQGADTLLSHFAVKGTVPGGQGMDPDALGLERFDRVFLGDIHDPMEIGNVQYVGAPMQHHYGDAGGERGVVVFDASSGKTARVSNNVSPRFHVIRESKKKPRVKGADYVRIAASDVDDDVYRETGAKVERVVPKETHEAQFRLDISAATADADVLRKYADHVGGENPEELVEAGIRLLQEVSGEDQ